MKSWLRSYLKPETALFYALPFAVMVAEERGSDTLEPRDALAGIYIATAEFDSLLRYWSDQGALERLLKSVCGTLNPRLVYWCRWANSSGKSLRKRWSFGSRFKKVSPDLQRVVVSARDFASRRGQGSGKDQMVVPEDVLLALVRLEDHP